MSLRQVIGWQGVMAQANDAVLTTDALGTITFANARAAELFGVDPAHLSGKSIAHFIPGADYLITGHHRGSELLELYGIRSDREFAVELSLAGSRDGDAQVFVLIVRDATARAELVETLAERDGRIAELEALANVGSYEYELATATVVWSAQLYRICGVAPEIVPSVTSLLRHAHSEDRPRVARFVSAARTSREPSLLDFRIVRPDGEVRRVTAQLQVRADRRGRPVRHTCTIRDVTASDVRPAVVRPRRTRSPTSRSRT